MNVWSCPAGSAISSSLPGVARVFRVSRLRYQLPGFPITFKFTQTHPFSINITSRDRVKRDKFSLNCSGRGAGAGFTSATPRPYYGVLSGASTRTVIFVGWGRVGGYFGFRVLAPEPIYRAKGVTVFCRPPQVARALGFKTYRV